MSVLWVLVVSGVVGWQRGSVYPRVIESTVTLVPAASLHHEVTTHGPLGHVCQEEMEHSYNHATHTSFAEP